MQRMQKKKEEDTSGKITAASSYWIPFIIFSVIWLLAYLFIGWVRDVSNIVFALLRADPNVLIAFLGLLLVFIVWSFIEFISIKTVHIARYHDDQMFMVKRGVRIVTIIYPIILIVCRYVTIWKFLDWPLYLFSLVLFLPFLALIMKTKWFSTPTPPHLRVEFDLKKGKVYVPVQLVLLVAFTIGPIFILILSSFTEHVEWIDDFVNNVIIQFLINSVFITMGVLLILFTIAYPFTELLAWKFAYLAKLVITNDTKKAMKKVRWYICLFVMVLTLSKLLPLAAPQLQLFSQGNLLYSAISAILVITISILQAKIVLARSKVAQQKKS